MASVQTPVRLPFGVLDSSKLRNLQSIKNCQNAIAPSSASKLKRRHEELDLSDSENVDPFTYNASSKRVKTCTEDAFCKPSSFTLRAYSKPKSRLSSLSALPPRPQTPNINTIKKPAIPASAPAAAGRSPTNPKRQGILSNRRTRLNAPSFGSRNNTPLSLAAAVSGTLANKNKRRVDNATLEASKPKSWFFDIFEETEQQQKENITLQKPLTDGWEMLESATTLDISDDEGKRPARDVHQKENIPPNGFGRAAMTITSPAASTYAAASRKDMMIDEPRTPLGDLNAADYYGEGYDATSVVLVAEDVVEADHHSDDSIPANLVPQQSSSDFNLLTHDPTPAFEDQDKPMTASQLTDLLLTAVAARVDSEAGVYDNTTQDDDENGDVATVEPADIEIWESGSAKDESGEMEIGESIFAEL